MSLNKFKVLCTKHALLQLLLCIEPYAFDAFQAVSLIYVSFENIRNLSDHDHIRTVLNILFDPYNLTRKEINLIFLI